MRMGLGTQEEAQNTEIAGCSNRIFPCARTVGQLTSGILFSCWLRVCTIGVEEGGREGPDLEDWFKALVNKYEPGEQCGIITVKYWTTTHE